MEVTSNITHNYTAFQYWITVGIHILYYSFIKFVKCTFKVSTQSCSWPNPGRKENFKSLGQPKSHTTSTVSTIRVIQSTITLCISKMIVSPESCILTVQQLQLEIFLCILLSLRNNLWFIPLDSSVEEPSVYMPDYNLSKGAKTLSLSPAWAYSAQQMRECCSVLWLQQYQSL